METYRQYPGFEQRKLETDIDQHLENLERLGYSILQDVLDEKLVKLYVEKLDECYKKQDLEFGAGRLKELNEHPTHRGLLTEDKIFADLVIHPKVWKVISHILGETAILNLQNASAAFPHVKHFQSSFHRDFAKDFVATKPLSINAFWCMTNFTADTGATWVVPYTHKTPYLPSEKYNEENALQIVARPGSVIFWDSLLLHKAGFNTSPKVRYGINHMYTRPFIKQQIDFPVYLKDLYDKESKLGQVLGFWTIPPKSVKEFRVNPSDRTYRSGQG